MRRRIAVMATIAASMLATGCGPGREGPFGVSGSVRYNGRPIEDGAIYFVDRSTEAVAGFSVIRAGAYTARVQPGHWIVRITGNRRVPDRTNEAGNPLIEQYVAPRFNDSSELDVTIENSRRLDWNLATSN